MQSRRHPWPLPSTPRLGPPRGKAFSTGKEGAAIEARVAHLLAERDARLRDLARRFALRASIRPVAAFRALVPPATQGRFDCPACSSPGR
jgi:hypothetical protein